VLISVHRTSLKKIIILCYSALNSGFWNTIHDLLSQMSLLTLQHAKSLSNWGGGQGNVSYICTGSTQPDIQWVPMAFILGMN